jgi:5-methylthioadenosine/S-adenosylhomocysteine deaminase
MLLKAKWVLPIESAPIKDGAVLVSGTKIKDVGKASELIKKYKKEKIIDFGLAALMPGLIDLHTHLEFSVFRGLTDDLPFTKWKIAQHKKSKKLIKDDWQLSAELGAVEAVKSGITTIADITTTGASIQPAINTGLRGVVFYEVTGLEHKNIKQKMDLVDKTVKSWQKQTKGTLIEVGVAPHSPYTVAPPLFKAVSDFAIKNKLRVSIHLAGSKDEYQFVKYGSGPLAIEYKQLAGWGDVLWQPTGVSPVKYLEQWDAYEGKVMAVHVIQVDDYDIDILSKYGVNLIYCPRFGAKMAMGIAPVQKFIERNMVVGLGTDSPASNNTFDLFEEMRVGLMLQRAQNQTTDNFSAEDFIKMATINGAKILGLEKEIGSLRKGKQADIIAIDLSQSHQIPTRDPYSAIVYTVSQPDVIHSMVNGKVIYDANNDLRDEKLYKKIEKIRTKLRN